MVNKRSQLNYVAQDEEDERGNSKSLGRVGKDSRLRIWSRGEVGGRRVARWEG